VRVHLRVRLGVPECVYSIRCAGRCRSERWLGRWFCVAAFRLPPGALSGWPLAGPFLHASLTFPPSLVKVPVPVPVLGAGSPLLQYILYRPYGPLSSVVRIVANTEVAGHRASIATFAGRRNDQKWHKMSRKDHIRSVELGPWSQVEGYHIGGKTDQ
jgi:hypothetical protein